MSEVARRKHLPKLILTHGFSYTFAILGYVICWFCLWNVSLYLSHDILLAGLLLPTGFKLAVYTLTTRKLWPWFTTAEIILVWSLIQLTNEASYSYLLILFACFNHAIAVIFQTIWRPLQIYWQRLLALSGLAIAYALACGFALLLLTKPIGLGAVYAFQGAIAALTGGILLAPFIYLVYDYLLRQVWQPLTPTLIHQEVSLRASALIWCLLFFAIGLFTELTLLEQMKPLALLIFLLPNIFMAYRYGWQGGVLASVMNSILLATARQVTGSFGSDLELQTFISTQALIGLGLGIAISRQYFLAQQLHRANKKLEQELASKQQLARQLVHVEEDIRKSVARELHDEIGQNITAIQIQSMLTKRLAKDEQQINIANTTNELALRIHNSTRQLLKQLRPHALDELGLESAIRQLAAEMRFDERGIDFRLNFGIFADRLDDITAVTLYRIVQELLNNTCKHAEATQVQLSLVPGDRFSLELRDNGIGLPDNWRLKGQGLKGIEERISALGGTMSITSNSLGSRIFVNLPTKHKTPPPN
ncbi:signal transduction histidine-protein kinase/phosphatase UhpB [Vibrio ponticus]|uniref:Signal transduction histidine-protein kinase/phosphatase UhpB n=1 Tax=Vibrio ponticus TaxID=265668 RepID=A0A3N3DTY9_9VIBR|nr:signal transduction histidine-protein kinase/phosphatase UhpB [Vibrio ponticus]ROV57957.1 signal transduction histidine-protein kinase/phosphatase UhpB [Vibrio ponticus]